MHNLRNARLLPWRACAHVRMHITLTLNQRPASTTGLPVQSRIACPAYIHTSSRLIVVSSSVRHRQLAATSSRSTLERYSRKHTVVGQSIISSSSMASKTDPLTLVHVFYACLRLRHRLLWNLSQAQSAPGPRSYQHSYEPVIYSLGVHTNNVGNVLTLLSVRICIQDKVLF